jgi:hypothetical protein
MGTWSRSIELEARKGNTRAICARPIAAELLLKLGRWLLMPRAENTKLDQLTEVAPGFSKPVLCCLALRFR